MKFQISIILFPSVLRNTSKQNNRIEAGPAGQGVLVHGAAPAVQAPGAPQNLPPPSDRDRLKAMSRTQLEDIGGTISC